jgi:hypothetical protein
MKLKHLTSAAMMVASWLIVGSCAFDERELTLAVPQLGIGGSAAGAGAGGVGLSEATPRLAVGTTAIDLGWVTTGFAARARIRVDNLGTAPLPPPAVAFAAGSHADFALIQNGCAEELAAGESCELRVQLVPSGAGERAATLEVRSEMGGEAQVVLNGLGLAGGDLILAPVADSFEDFGGARIGTTQEETFSISNPTDVPSGPLRFRVNRPEFALLAPGDGDCVPDVTSLVGGQSCTLRLAFTPTERGPLEATLTGATDGAGVHQPRNRRTCLGELIQIDGCDHSGSRGAGGFDCGPEPPDRLLDDEAREMPRHAWSAARTTPSVLRRWLANSRGRPAPSRRSTFPLPEVPSARTRFLESSGGA